MSSDLQTGLTKDMRDEGKSKDLRTSYSSHWHVPKEEHLGGISDDAVRAGFRAKVYGILCFQLAITVLVGLACSFIDSLRHTCLQLAQQGNIGVVILIPTIVSLCLLFCVKNKFPQNFVTLIIFTLCISTNIGFVCAIYYEAGAGLLILLAFGMTLVVFVGLTAFVLISGKNFGYCGGFLSVLLLALSITGLVGIFIPGVTDNLFFATGGSVLFSLYIMFDTWKIEQVFGPDDYIIAAIELYLDIVNLFLYILQILSRDD
mmetsp:Transcript_52595/g.122413  ORF Transcript_52595/g.122413 Transcript_52595/m.122413 type:complete len:260 (-) Transcript_52595:71-850(-)